ncbi:MAG: hypothetical protein KJI70_00690 [Patescibacteria group bacterium]|nr:hypothetical protein [Patescibacteria group bacterium]
MKLKLITTIILFSLISSSASSIGIYPVALKFDDELLMGKRYKNSQITIINTNDEAGYFKVGVANLTKENFDKLNSDWIKIKPEKFYLEVGSSQTITLSLKIPPKTRLIYFQVYGVIETFSVEEVESGVMGVGVAVGSKLSFKVSKKNVPKWKLLWWNITDRLRYFMAWGGNFMPFSFTLKR